MVVISSANITSLNFSLMCPSLDDFVIVTEEGVRIQASRLLLSIVSVSLKKVFAKTDLER